MVSVHGNSEKVRQIKLLSTTDWKTWSTSTRVQLFDSTNQAAWQHPDGRAPAWPVSGGEMEVASGGLRTRQGFQVFRAHVGFRLPNLPPDVTGQDRANSGVYLQKRYEVQPSTRTGDTTLADNEAGRSTPRRPRT